MRHRVNLRRLPDGLVRLQTSLRVNQMRRKNGVNQRRLSQTRLACNVSPATTTIRTSKNKGRPVISRLCTKRTQVTRTNDDHVELETTLQELVLNLLRDGVETDVGVSTNLFSGGHDEDRQGNGNVNGAKGRG